MTGDAPYYGGRLTPGQAYAASQPNPPATRDPQEALEQLRETGVIDEQEYEQLRTRIAR